MKEKIIMDVKCSQVLLMCRLKGIKFSLKLKNCNLGLEKKKTNWEKMCKKCLKCAIF